MDKTILKKTAPGERGGLKKERLDESGELELKLPFKSKLSFGDAVVAQVKKLSC